MEEINKLDDKYLVIKKEDLERYFSKFTKGLFTTVAESRQMNEIPFLTVIDEIKADRKSRGKNPQNYVVLNLDDELEFNYLLSKIEGHKKDLETPYIPVKDIAVDLINSIIISGNP